MLQGTLMGNIQALLLTIPMTKDKPFGEEAKHYCER
jgi:hypothetical protein